MLIKDIRKEFYNIVRDKHVLIVCNIDVDAVCACKIIQYLFRSDHISHTVVAVSGIENFIRVIQEYSSQVSYVLLVNCGANINLIDVLRLEKTLIFYVVDSRRPYDLDNIYDPRQVRLIIDSEELKSIKHPTYDEIYRDDSEDENSEEDDVIQSPRSKRHRRNKRLEKEAWIHKRNQLLFDYYEFSYYHTSSAVILFDLAYKLSKDNAELLWYAAVGLTSQLMEANINLSKYTLDSTDVQQHMKRHNHSIKNDASCSVDCMKLFFEKDLALTLYTHWTLLDSLRHTASTSCHFRSWTLNGQRKLLNFLADLGLPLSQCEQKFSANDVKLRKEAKESIFASAEKYGLSELIIGSFISQNTYSYKFSASDVAHSISALLNFRFKDDNHPMQENFLKALDGLSKDHYKCLYEGIELYKKFSRILMNEVQMSLTTGHIIPCSSILQCVLSQGTPGWRYFISTYGITSLGRFLNRAFLQTPRGQKHKYKPLIVVIPLCDEEGMVLIAGIAPCFVHQEGEKPVNFLGRAFQRISERTNCRMRQNSFDMSIVELKSEDRHRFCDALVALIEA